MPRVITVTLGERAAREAEALHRAFLTDGVIAFASDRVRVLREQVERVDHGLRWTFDLEIIER